MTIVLSTVTFAHLGFGQKQEKTKVVSVPWESGLVFVTNPPDCPLKIIEAELLTTDNGASPIVRYVLKSNSTKAIRYFSVAYVYKHNVQAWHRFGSSGEHGVGRDDGKGPDLIANGGSYTNWQKSEYELTLLTPNVKDLLTPKPNEMSLRFAAFLLINKIIFSDGSVYNAKETSENLFNLLWIADDRH